MIPLEWAIKFYDVCINLELMFTNPIKQKVNS